MASASRPMVLIGAVQGVALWWLWHAAEYQLWPTSHAVLLGICLWLTLFLPALYYLSENALAGRPRRLLLIAGALFYGMVGAYAGWMGESLEHSRRALHWFVGTSPSQWLAAMAIGFMAIPLLAGRGHYPELFRVAWRNALLAVSVIALTGVFWIVLGAGAALMKSLGLRFFFELISKPLFYFPITGVVIGAVFAQSHARASTLELMRGFWLSLNSWLLPLLLSFGVMWVVALPFTGLEPLLATRSAAFFLLWFTALSVNFINCAWQDGRQPAPYPLWLARLISLAWLSLPVVTAVAGWALLLRIRQYGWTEDRVWAAFIWAVAALYSVGYASSLFVRRAPHWMSNLGRTNILVALLAMLTLACLITPLADPRRLAVNSQVKRLLAGAVAAHEFDYHYLRWQSGRWGTQALSALASQQADRDIAGRAAQALAQQQRHEAVPLPETDSVLAERLQVLDGQGQTTTLPDSLLHFLNAPDKQHGGSRQCINPDSRCLIWLSDLDGDGTAEAVLLVERGRRQGLSGYVLNWQDGDWHSAAHFYAPLTSERWRQAIQSGAIQLQPPRWPELQLEEQAIRLQPY